MSDLLIRVASPEELDEPIAALRAAFEVGSSTEALIDECNRWSKALLRSRAREVPGVIFLSMWLRGSHLTALVERELPSLLDDSGWTPSGAGFLQAVPLGLVGHWSASNVTILPFLSVTGALLGGNPSLVRVPPALYDIAEAIVECIPEDCPQVRRMIRCVSFDSDLRQVHERMAQAVRGALIWGGEESIAAVRSLPFPADVRIQCFGPRSSVSVMSAGAWTDPEERSRWCTRLVRDVWQFDQQACSSPQVLFVERSPAADIEALCTDLESAFVAEAAAHPRESMTSSGASAVTLARARCLLEAGNKGWFPMSPEWTLLLHQRIHLPEPAQMRTLHIVPVESADEVLALLTPTIQTVGVAFKDADREQEYATRVARRGVDRVVKLGTMHIFNSPWDGMELVRPLVRHVRLTPSTRP